MADVRNIAQPVRTRVLAPKPVYSRVIGLQVNVAGGMGVGSFIYTPYLGNKIRLLNVKCLLFGGTVAAPVGGFIYITTGSGKEVTYAIVLFEWDMIIPCLAGGKPGIYWWGDNVQLSWDMDRLYTDKERRFGVAIQNGFAANWYGLFWFQFSEG